MEILVTGQSEISADLIGQPSLEASLESQPDINLNLIGDASIDATLEESQSLEIKLEAKVIDSYKDVDKELSKTSNNPVENQVIAKAIETITPILISEAEFESLGTKDENRTYFVYEEE